MDLPGQAFISLFPSSARRFSATSCATMVRSLTQSRHRFEFETTPSGSTSRSRPVISMQLKALSIPACVCERYSLIVVASSAASRLWSKALASNQTSRADR
jgi:hypothetical protein